MEQVTDNWNLKNAPPKQPKGGTELLHEALLSEFGGSIGSDINFLISHTNQRAILSGKKNILWNHLSYDQEAMKGLANAEFLKRIDALVFVSHWQYEKFRYFFELPMHKCFVIKNAIPAIDYAGRSPRDGKIKLIYTSTPWRGLDVLLDAFDQVEDPQVELHVYSSTQIYGEKFHLENTQKFDALWSKARSSNRVQLHGYKSNAEVRQALMTSHIYVYPSTFEETSCLSALEAAMAGCRLLVTNFGALFETLGEWPEYVNINYDKVALTNNFAQRLNRLIKQYRTQDNESYLRAQSEYFNRFWTWKVRKPEWEALFSWLRSI